MRDGNPVWMFVLAVLAVWRLTHLLAAEDGPWDVVVRVRMRLGASVLGKLMDCFYCLSLWIALPVAIWLGQAVWLGRGQGWVLIGLEWLALSGAACLLEQLTRRDIARQRISESFPNLETLVHFGTLPSSAALNFGNAAQESMEGGTPCAVVKSEAHSIPMEPPTLRQ
jgi:hypothetical protein